MPLGFLLVHCNDKALSILREIKPFLIDVNEILHVLELACVVFSMNDKANSILDILFSSVNVGFKEDVWMRQTSHCNNIRCTVLNATPIAFSVEQYVLR